MAIQEVSTALSGLTCGSPLGPGCRFFQAESTQRPPAQQLSGLVQARKSTTSSPPLPASFRPWLMHQLCARHFICYLTLCPQAAGIIPFYR